MAPKPKTSAATREASSPTRSAAWTHDFPRALNQVWATDITYIPMKTGFVYHRYYHGLVLASRPCPGGCRTRSVQGFCVEALEEALDRFDPPGIAQHGPGRAVHRGGLATAPPMIGPIAIAPDSGSLPRQRLR